MQAFGEIDTGLSKKALQEVQMMIEFFEKKLEKRFESFEHTNERREEASKEFRAKIYKAVDDLRTSITGLEFKHNWKTAMWVFIGAALPNVIGIAFLIVRMVK